MTAEILAKSGCFWYQSRVIERVNARPPLTTWTLSEARMAKTKLHPESGFCKTLTADRLRALLRYDPLTGEFTRLTGRYAGSPAGARHDRGYLHVRVDGCRYYGHRLAVLYMTGKWPDCVTDHKNRQTTDCRWENLRPATYSQNSVNRTRTARPNTSGAVGVHQTPSGRWRAQYCKNGRQTHIGLFDTREEASSAYRSVVEARHGEFVNPGMFDRRDAA